MTQKEDDGMIDRAELLTRVGVDPCNYANEVKHLYVIGILTLVCLAGVVFGPSDRVSYLVPVLTLFAGWLLRGGKNGQDQKKGGGQ